MFNFHKRPELTPSEIQVKNILQSIEDLLISAGLPDSEPEFLGLEPTHTLSTKLEQFKSDLDLLNEIDPEHYDQLVLKKLVDLAPTLNGNLKAKILEIIADHIKNTYAQTSKN